ANDWVEVIDDAHELSDGIRLGVFRQVKDVDSPPRAVSLTKPLPAGEFPVDAQGNVTEKSHSRVVRWDQSGKVRDNLGNVVVDLDAAGSTGLITVPAGPTPLILEDGVQVTFSVDPAGGEFRTGDYWVFAARTADGTVEPLTAAPPRGI